MRKTGLLIVIILICIVVIGCSEPEPSYIIGETGPAGGLIFFVNPNSSSDSWTYLEAAPPVWDGASQDPEVMWSNITSVQVGGTSISLGTGKSNTEAIINQSGHITSAAKLCDDCTYGGYNDWFLPSGNELSLLYQNLYLLVSGDFQSAFYWSSTESSNNEAFSVNFANQGDLAGSYKSSSHGVRLVEPFSDINNFYLRGEAQLSNSSFSVHRISNMSRSMEYLSVRSVERR